LYFSTHLTLPDDYDDEERQHCPYSQQNSYRANFLMRQGEEIEKPLLSVSSAVSIRPITQSPCDLRPTPTQNHQNTVTNYCLLFLDYFREL
jgi:hypothetical protein